MGGVVLQSILFLKMLGVEWLIMIFYFIKRRVLRGFNFSSMAMVCVERFYRVRCSHLYKFLFCR